ncbi:maleylpyruvate isomerase N-terminal domain-containing protein [Actinokineospora bangkokensis]|uniref:Mycothiol-dependent maleylpyruvate isomerase metal-binding domain-containing protein n=1 Tax=Actinokineospora bangkokensis TaxID=1193682 RepID=A0A1Q9LHY0_9PSEU|nr:maleylpyruvate isomerase N-terminal domain-containing protein [Actinokineospora bangkokensis]OLR91559.1 hypothetical protein BJP25_25680 [Actinokineospora bangkokensis]
MDGTTLLRAVEHSAGFLERHLDGDWRRPGEQVEMSAAQLVAHMANCLLWYGVDFCAGPRELATNTVSVDDGAEPVELLRALRAAGRVLAAVVDAADPGDRGWHPAGIGDASGFAGMGCDEVVVHTHDAAQALGVDFEGPADVAHAVLGRMFPWAPAGGDRWQVLLWANGRAVLGARPRLTSWRWHVAPLAEWDGTRP